MPPFGTHNFVKAFFHRKKGTNLAVTAQIFSGFSSTKTEDFLKLLDQEQTVEAVNEQKDYRDVKALCYLYLTCVVFSSLGNLVYLAVTNSTSPLEHVVYSALWLYFLTNIANGIFLLYNMENIFCKIIYISTTPKLLSFAGLYILGFVAIAVGLGTGSYNLGLIITLYILNMVTVLCHCYINVCIGSYLDIMCSLSLKYPCALIDKIIESEDEKKCIEQNKQNFCRIQNAAEKLRVYLEVKSGMFVINLTYILIIILLSNFLGVSTVYMFTEIYWIAASTFTSIAVVSNFNSSIDEIEELNDVKLYDIKMNILFFGPDPVAWYSFFVGLASVLTSVIGTKHN